MVTTTTPAPTSGQPTSELARIISGLAHGDSAMIFTLASRYGRAITTALVDAGIAPATSERLVHDVVLTVAHLAPTAPLDLATPWDIVAVAIDAVAARQRRPDPPGPGAPISLRPTERSTPAPRRALHLVDVDNLVGGPSDAAQWFATSMNQYAAVADIGPDDQIVLSADVSAYRVTAFGVTGVAYRPGYGPDGADAVLLEAADPDHVVARFDRLVIGSGDHCFAPLATQLATRGVDVTVVARPRQLANVLRLAASEVHLLADLPPTHRLAA